MKSFLAFFKNLFGRGVDKKVLSGIDIDIDKINEDPQVAVRLQEKYQSNSESVEELSKNLPKLKSEFESIQKIEKLSQKAKEDLEGLAKIYSETLLEKTDFKNKVKFNSGEDYLANYGDSVLEALDLMKETEEYQLLVKRDLAYLEAEKEEILYQKNRLIFNDKMINILFVIVSVLSLSILGLVSVFLARTQFDIVVAFSATLILIVLTTIWAYFTRRLIKVELGKNTKLLTKVITLINKTKIKYINNKKLLDYQYKKYKVDSYYMFTVRWKNYNDNKDNIRRYKKINNSISALISDIENLLTSIAIKDDSFVFDNIDYFMSAEGRKKLKEKYENLIDEIDGKIKKYEKENAVIYIVLANYKSSQSAK